MNKNDVNMLIIESNPLIVHSYKAILNNIYNDGYCVKIEYAKDFDNAIKLIKRAKAFYQIVLLDLSPTSKNEHYACGEDLLSIIRKISPKTETILLGAALSRNRILNIVNEFEPAVFLIESDREPQQLINAFKLVLNGGKYYSRIILEYCNGTISKEIIIDDFDRKILYHLSMGEMTKDLPKFVPLSMRTIELRKSKLKMLLGITKNNKLNLIKEAKKKGLI